MDNLIASTATLENVARLALAVAFVIHGWRAAQRVWPEGGEVAIGSKGKRKLPTSAGLLLTIVTFFGIMFLSRGLGNFTDQGNTTITNVMSHEVVTSVINLNEGALISIVSMIITLSLFFGFLRKIKSLWGLLVGYLVFFLLSAMVWNLVGLSIEFALEGTSLFAQSQSWRTGWDWFNQVLNFQSNAQPTAVPATPTPEPTPTPFTLLPTTYP
jgi:uncharacterized membrane protein YphA (DoxX/SURF4 family)